MRFLNIMLLFLLALIASPAHAQMMPTGDMKAVMPDVPRGRFEGQVMFLEGEKKKPMAHQTVALMVFQNGERILMLNKQTDEKGRFEFKNIFRDPSFTYAIGSMHEEQVYVLPKLGLLPSEESKTVELVVGAGSPHLMAAMVPGAAGAGGPAAEAGSQDMGMGGGMAPRAGSGKAPFSAHSILGQSHQKVALFLSLAVILLAFYFAKSKKY